MESHTLMNMDSDSRALRKQQTSHTGLPAPPGGEEEVQDEEPVAAVQQPVGQHAQSHLVRVRGHVAGHVFGHVAGHVGMSDIMDHMVVSSPSTFLCFRCGFILGLSCICTHLGIFWVQYSRNLVTYFNLVIYNAISNAISMDIKARHQEPRTVIRNLPRSI